MKFTRYCRTVLWTSATSPQRFERAHRCGADICMVDLEDSVAPEHKTLAREQAAAFFTPPPVTGTRRGIRVNTLAGSEGLRDLLAIQEYPVAPDIVALPKVETARDVELVDRILSERCPRTALFAIVETPRGIAAATAIAAASARLRALLFGAADYSFSVGADRSWAALAFARAALVNGARAAGVEAVDSPMFEITGIDGLRGECAQARNLGFSGKAAIHPDHIPVIEAAFSPDEDTLAAARRVVAGDGDVTSVDGVMVGRPFFDASQRLLADFDPADRPPTHDGQE